MSSFNVMTGGRAQVLVDEQQLQQVQAELARRGAELERLKSAMETLSAVNAPAHFVAAAMALCNELASRWHAERVGLGYLKGRYVRLKALSHTEKITRNMQLVQDIEGAMEECLDQNVEVLYPPPKDASFVYRSTELLATRQGAGTVCSFPLRRTVASKGSEQHEGENVVAVLTIERKGDKPFKLEEIEALRLTCDLFTARLSDLHEHDRWVGVKAAKSVKHAIAWGPMAKHTWAKVAAIAVAGFLAFALLVNGSLKVEAPFEFKASEEQIVAAPIDGFIEKVYVDKGDLVITEETAARYDALRKVSPLLDLGPVKRPPTVLATLDTKRLKDELVQAQAQLRRLELDEMQARATPESPTFNPTAESMKLHAQAEEVTAKIQQIEGYINDASIKAKIDGVVFLGELKKKIGGPVTKGDALFQIGQLGKLYAELSVPEDQVAELREGQRGELKATSLPGQPIHFTVTLINPVAEVVSGKNVFKVRVALDPADVKPWMMPGVEGLAKVEVGKAKYAWLWTSRMINWVRMKLWI